MKRLIRILVAVFAVGVLLSPTPAFSQAWETDDYGFLIENTPSTRANSRRMVRRPQRRLVPQLRYSVAQRPSVTTTADSASAYRSFSYAPAAFAKGDNVVVVGKHTQLMKGSDVVGNVALGTEMTVLETQGPWVGVTAKIDGQERIGWICYGNLKLAGEVVANTTSGDQQYRSFSYQPAAAPVVSGQTLFPSDRSTTVSSHTHKPTYLRHGAKAKGDFGHGGR